MKYDDFLDARMQEAARTYLDGLERAGLEPNPTLTQAVAERAIREANEAYRKRYPWRARLTDPRFLRVPACAGFVLVCAEDAILTLVRHQGAMWALLDALIAVVFLFFTFLAWRRRG